MAKQETALRTLSPIYQPEQHDHYVRTLMTEMRRSGDAVARNIALTGHYGSGKSSVLVEVERQLRVGNVKVINLSLPSLGIGQARLETPGEQTKLDTTNLIQKEIVKQLLYRRRPSDAPASRYNRLDTFQRAPAFRRAAGTAAALTGLALLLKVPDKVRAAFPARFWTSLDERLWDGAAITAQWTSLMIVFGLVLGATVWAQRVFHQRLRLTELAAGPAKVALSENSTSYFDEYLDEIVYFFQNSGTTVVVFEDLDRFEDAHIFETLRELNMLLNNAEQTGSEPIRFVYAIRDSIFEKLDTDPDDGGESDDGSTAKRSPAETRRLMSTNRTKFFDLVVPMVPFISHRTSRQLIADQLVTVEEDQRPSPALIDLVGVHLTDMRLIKNICNEFDVFRLRILGNHGLEGLTADRLFASIVYKNVYLKDYERIRHAESAFDELYGAFRGWVAARSQLTRTRERAARVRLNRGRPGAVGYRSKRLGERLQAVLTAWSPNEIRPEYFKIVLNQKQYAWSDLVEPTFWLAYLKDQEQMRFIYHPGYGIQGNALSFNDVQVLMDEELSSEDWETKDAAEQRRILADAADEQRFVAKATLTDALDETGKLFSFKGKDQSLSDVARQLFPDTDQLMVLELLRDGYLDENFALYVTQFPGRGSAKAMNFILKAVQPDQMDMVYQFGSDDVSIADDINMVIQTEGLRLLHGRSVFNVQIFDHLLAEDSDQLDDAIRRLGRAANEDREFIEAYLDSGKQQGAFLRRLSGEWPGIFRFLIGDDSEAPTVEWLDAALRGAEPSTGYQLADEQQEAMAAILPQLPLAAEALDDHTARSIARVIQDLEVRVGDIAQLAMPLRDELAARDLYEITRANLIALLGSAEDLSLDRTKAGHDEVYHYMLSNLQDYLAAIADGDSIPAVADTDAFADVLRDVAKANAGELASVAAASAGGCMLDNLDALDAVHWPAVARAKRLLPTVPVITQYIAEYGFDEPVAEHLSALQSFVISEGETGRSELALRVLNAPAFRDDTKMALLGSLKLTKGSIVANSLEAPAHSLIPRLVRGGWVDDNAEAYTCLGDDEWPVKQSLIEVSKTFIEYMLSLTFSAPELRDLAGPGTPDAVKQAILNHHGQFESNLDSVGATRLAGWAATKQLALDAPLLLSLATKSGSKGAEPIIALLAIQAQSLDLPSLIGTLNALGDPYSQVTSPGRTRPKLTPYAGTDAVLDRLQHEGIVSKYEPKSKRGQAYLEVSKRYR